MAHDVKGSLKSSDKGSCYHEAIDASCYYQTWSDGSDDNSSCDEALDSQIMCIWEKTFVVTIWF